MVLEDESEVENDRASGELPEDHRFQDGPVGDLCELERRQRVAVFPLGARSPSGDSCPADVGLAFDGENKLYASEGESGQVRIVDPSNGKRLGRLNLNVGKLDDSYSGDLAFDSERSLLYVVDQANFRVAIFNTKTNKLVSSVRVGRLPFAIALSP